MLYEFQKGVSVETAQKTFQLLIWIVLLLSRPLKSDLADFRVARFVQSKRNNRPHTAQQTLLKLQWEILQHPPYYLDIICSGPCKITEKQSSFIDKLVNRWNTIVKNNGNYYP